MVEVSAYMDAMQRVHRVYRELERRGARWADYRIHMHPVRVRRVVDSAPWEGVGLPPYTFFGLPVVPDERLPIDAIVLRQELVA